MDILLDTSAWIEHFKKTEKDERVKNLLREKLIYTCPLTITEIVSWCYKNNENPSQILSAIKTLSSIVELSEEILVLSGRIYNEQRKINNKIGLIDCIIYTTALHHRLFFVTTDNDFRDLPSVEII